MSGPLPTKHLVTDLQYWALRGAGETAPAVRQADGMWRFLAPVAADIPSDSEALRTKAAERVRPIPVPVPVLAALIKAALGSPLTATETQQLQDQLADLAPQCALLDAVAGAKSAADINAAAGGKLWPI